MVASVPELTIRSISIWGMMALTFCAINVSISVGAPKAQAIVESLMDLRNHLRVAMTDNHRSPGADVIDVALIVFVDQIGAAALFKKRLGCRRLAEKRGTGELTPPGRTCLAASKSDAERLMMLGQRQ